MNITISPAATLPVFASLDDAAHAILQPGVQWQSAAAMIVSCMIAFGPKESVPLLTMIRHILEHELVVRELLLEIRKGLNEPDENLKAACDKLIQAATAQRSIRAIQRS